MKEKEKMNGEKLKKKTNSKTILNKRKIEIKRMRIKYDKLKIKGWWNWKQNQIWEIS